MKLVRLTWTLNFRPGLSISTLFYYFINSFGSVDIDNGFGYWGMKVVEKLFLLTVSDRDNDMFENSGKAHQI